MYLAAWLAASCVATAMQFGSEECNHPLGQSGITPATRVKIMLIILLVHIIIAVSPVQSGSPS